MTNPQATMRMLITYVISIAAAVFVGWLLTNPLDYGTLGFLGLILAVLISPVFIKWHYPIMVFALGSPIVLFFLKGSPSFSMFMVMVSFGIAVVERTINSDRRFISVPSLTWPLVYTFGVVLLTAKLNGGIGFHTLGSSDGDVVGGGKKYLTLFLGIVTYFALSSRPIPVERRNLYVALFFLPAMMSFVSDLFAYLPSPLNYINLLIPPSQYLWDSGALGRDGPSVKRFAGIGALALALVTYLLARYGLRELVFGGPLWRRVLFFILPFLSIAGGFRSIMVQLSATLALLFFLEGLHRTRLVVPIILGGALAVTVVLPFAGKLPPALQRSISFLPLPNLDPVVVMDAQSTAEWRYQMWSGLWPQVPNYLLLGKGFGLTKDDFTRMGTGTFVSSQQESFDPTSVGLAVSSDFHNGPLSILIPFGIWGAIAFLWFTVVGFRLLYRNYRYGDPGLKVINRFLLITAIVRWLAFMAIGGAFVNDLGYFAGLFGLSVAFNGGLRGPASQPVFQPAIRPVKPALAVRGTS